jgi:NAD(P)H-quinone oxidoreductase subunit 5
VILTAAAFCLAFGATVGLVLRGPLDVALLQVSRPLPLSLGVYFDSLSAVMLLLISFIGLVITAYSIRYLDGEARQGRFLRWILFTLGAVLLLVVSRNLVMFTVSWMLTSFGLHQLLTHYPDRPWAIWAARKKFLISRLGDVMLIAALILTYHNFGSFEYRDIFAAAESMQATGSAAPLGLASLIATLYVVGAMTKSAQFPFHSWLPDTMETPTPVSALMHAGIINAGGFLVIRLSPLVSLSHVALDFLALAGTLTAFLGGVVMLTQSSVKRALAYSTVGQMGFMMLQCGLGAFSAALLHIVAHSLYKAHAFLSSGSVLESAARVRTTAPAPPRGRQATLSLLLAAAIAAVLCLSAAWLLGIEYAKKPGAPVLGLVLAIAVTQLLWHALATGSGRLATRGVLAAGVVCLGYFGAFLLMDRVLASSASHQTISAAPLDIAVWSCVAAGFVGVFVLQALATSGARFSWLQAFYVHALNGFYFDIPARRVTAWFWRQGAPTP